MYFSHSANKITASFEIDSLIGLLTNYALINSYGKHFCPVLCFFLCFIFSLSLYCLPSFLTIDSQALKHPWLAFVADLSNNDSLIPDNGTVSVEAVAVAAPAGSWICTDCSHLNPPKRQALRAKCRLTEPWFPELVEAFQHQGCYKLISLLWIFPVMETASLHHAFPNWKICIHTMLHVAQQWLWGMDWNRFPLFFVLSNTHINQCRTFFFSIITLFMFIFMIVYPIDNPHHLFSIVWSVLSIISYMIPPIFPAG